MQLIANASALVSGLAILCIMTLLTIQTIRNQKEKP
jgi:hypothetical protein